MNEFSILLYLIHSRGLFIIVLVESSVVIGRFCVCYLKR